MTKNKLKPLNLVITFVNIIALVVILYPTVKKLIKLNHSKGQVEAVTKIALSCFEDYIYENEYYIDMADMLLLVNYNSDKYIFKTEENYNVKIVGCYDDVSKFTKSFCIAYFESRDTYLYEYEMFSENDQDRQYLRVQKKLGIDEYISIYDRGYGVDRDENGEIIFDRTAYLQVENALAKYRLNAYNKNKVSISLDGISIITKFDDKYYAYVLNNNELVETEAKGTYDVSNFATGLILASFDEGDTLIYTHALYGNTINIVANLRAQIQLGVEKYGKFLESYTNPILFSIDKLPYGHVSYPGSGIYATGIVR